MSVIVRDDLAEAHRLAWEHLAGAGQLVDRRRTDRAGRYRPAGDRRPRPAAAVGGRHLHRHASAPSCAAPLVAHDIAYRLARHAGTITVQVYRATADELGELPYVELCAIVSTVAAVAHFCRNIDIPMPPLPAAVAGEPTGEPPGVPGAAAFNWVPVAEPADQVAAVVQAYTAVPGEDREHVAHGGGAVHARRRDAAA